MEIYAIWKFVLIALGLIFLFRRYININLMGKQRV